MARIFLAVAIALTLISGVVSLSTRSKVKSYQAEHATVQATLTSTNVAKEKAIAEAKALAEKMTQANTAKEAAESQLTAVKGDADKAQADLKDAKAKAEAATAELAKLKEATAAATPAPAATPDPEIEKKLKDAEAQLAEKKQIEDALEAKAKDLEARAKALETEKSNRDKGTDRSGLEGKILAVNGGWNFVVLNIGDRQGVSMNSVLLVRRGRGLVARLRVTSVEPATSIADVVPGSMVKGNSVQPGDLVIYSGS